MVDVVVLFLVMLAETSNTVSANIGTVYPTV